MSEKFPILIAYVGLGLLLALWPAWRQLRHPGHPGNARPLDADKQGSLFLVTTCVLSLALLMQVLPYLITEPRLLIAFGYFGYLAYRMYRRGRSRFTCLTLGLVVFVTALPWWWLLNLESWPRPSMADISAFATHFAFGTALCALLAIAAARLFGGPPLEGSLSIFSALLVATTLVWWRAVPGIHLQVSWQAWGLFGVLFLPTIAIFAPAARDPGSGGKTTVSPLLAALYLALSAYLSFATGLLEDAGVSRFVWHHWGAYIGPAEMLRNGAHLFTDIPTQYGLGPTLLVELACRPDCWAGMYYLNGIFNLLFGLLIAALAILAGGPKLSRTMQAAILALCLLCSYFWNAFPPAVASPMITPSVSGLRFLPAVAIVLLLALFDKRDAFSPSLEWMHGAWALGVLWSPESAFYCTLIWWPYYLWRRISSAPPQASAIRTAVLSLLRLFAMLALLAANFVAIHFLIYREFPVARTLFTYIANPPGIMKIDLGGAAWFSVLALIVASVTLHHALKRHGDSPRSRLVFLSLLLTYGVYSYFLGRSHDNNILNLLPFFLLTLLLALTTPSTPALWRTVAATLLAGIAALPVMFGWKPWLEMARQDRWLEFGPQNVRQALARLHNHEALAIIEHIRTHFGEPASLIDGSMNLAIAPGARGWSALYGPANFVFVPPEQRRTYLADTARRLDQKGWLVISRHENLDGWLADYDYAYQREITLVSANYQAIRYLPRPPLDTADKPQ